MNSLALLLAISRASVELIASTLLTLIGIYLILGLCFYVAFIAKGIARVDEAVEESPKVFFLLLLPGTVAFWPVLLIKWKRAIQYPDHD
jgi:hypothetical protein